VHLERVITLPNTFRASAYAIFSVSVLGCSMGGRNVAIRDSPVYGGVECVGESPAIEEKEIPPRTGKVRGV